MVPSGKVILVIEDEPEIGQLMKAALEDECFVVFRATTGREAMHFSSQVRPHVVLLDLMLPEMDGAAIGRRCSTAMVQPCRLWS